MTRVNRKPISKHMSYTIKELVVILDINEKTFLRWIDSGLKIIPGCKKPILILGSELKEFLKNKDLKKKVKLKRNQFYCFKCKIACYAKRGSVKEASGRKTGICRVCSGKMSRIIKPHQKDYKILSIPM